MGIEPTSETWEVHNGLLANPIALVTLKASAPAS
jgi:hypothetical protein